MEDVTKHNPSVSIRNIIMRTLSLFVVAIMVTLSASAQCKVKNVAFAAGENISYDLYYDWGIIWKKVGYANMETKTSRSRGSGAYDIKLLAIGNKTADIIFRLRDTLMCTVSKDLEPIYYKKAAEEGDRYSIDEAWYTYNNGVTHVAQKRTRPGKNDLNTSYDDSRCVYDMLSIIARARNYDMSSFEKTQKIKLPLATGRKVEEVTMKYLGKDKVKGKDGNTYRCLGFSIVTHDDKDNKDEELLRFFVSDDRNHLPVRIDFSLKIGAAVAYLKSAKGTLYPFDSIIKK